MALEIEQALESWCADRQRCFGQILIERSAESSFSLCHRDDAGRDGLTMSLNAEDAAAIAKFDDAGKYRPLRTAPNLRHGWRLELADVRALRHALDLFYPGPLAMFFVSETGRLRMTPLRETLERQTGIYRIAAKISDDQLDGLVGSFCRSDSGCLRTILWKRDTRGVVASTKLPPEKFDPAFDQTGHDERCIPLLCQEACNLLVNAARQVVKREP
jgi:sirohydrochlorin cobaltochelatase